jgi:hypothetical protein
MVVPPVRLLDKVRQFIRLKGYSIRTIWTQDMPGYIYRVRLPENTRTPTDNGDGSMRFLPNAIRRPKIRNEKKTSPARQQYSEGDSKIRKIVRNCQVCELSYAEAKLCHPPAGRWLRYPNGARPLRAKRR